MNVVATILAVIIAAALGVAALAVVVLLVGPLATAGAWHPDFLQGVGIAIFALVAAGLLGVASSQE